MWQNLAARSGGLRINSDMTADSPNRPLVSVYDALAELHKWNITEPDIGEAFSDWWWNVAESPVAAWRNYPSERSRSGFESLWEKWLFDMSTVVAGIFLRTKESMSILRGEILPEPAAWTYFVVRDLVMPSLVWAKGVHIVDYLIDALCGFETDSQWLTWANILGAKDNGQAVLALLRLDFDTQVNRVIEWLIELETLSRYEEGWSGNTCETQTFTLHDFEHLRSARNATGVRHLGKELKHLIAKARQATARRDLTEINKINARLRELKAAIEEVEPYITGTFKSIKPVEASKELIVSHSGLSPTTVERYMRALPKQKIVPFSSRAPGLDSKGVSKK